MKVYDLQNEKGNISALILVESREIEQQENCSEDEALTRAITNAILSLAESTGQKFMFTRILSYDEQDDGAVMVRFETAAAPEVKLGQYRGLRVPAQSARLHRTAATVNKSFCIYFLLIYPGRLFWMVRQSLI